MKKVILTKDAPAPIGPYSQAVAMGEFLFCSGQISINPKTNEVMTGTVEEQTEQIMKNIEAVLKANGMGFQNVIKTTIFLTKMSDFVKVNEIYGRFFREEPPARSTVAVAGLPKNLDVEIEVIAHR
jgi:2-iminobutanoate/2-iminopropanoate deaminase